MELIPDGATLQMGIGSLPSVVCSVLDRHNDLGIHTELLTPPMATLMEQGQCEQPVQEARHRQDGLHLRARRSSPLRVTWTVNPAIEGRPVSYVNDPRVIAQQDRFVSINSTLEIDLTGQCNSEFLNGYQYSGAGGQVDFVRGAYASRGGKSFMVLSSTAADGAVSRIVPRLRRAGDHLADGRALGGHGARRRVPEGEVGSRAGRGADLDCRARTFATSSDSRRRGSDERAWWCGVP